MSERIWTPARRRLVLVATLFGAAFADGMFLMLQVILDNPQLKALYGPLAGWAEGLATLLVFVGTFFGGEHIYLTLGLLGGIAGAIIGLFISEFRNV